MAQLIAPASRSRIRVAQIVETNRGETPDSGAYKIIPHLDNTALNQTQTFERSNLVKSNRQGGVQVGGTVQSGGTLGVPMMYDPAILELIESAISAAFATSGFTHTGTAATASFSITGGASSKNAITRATGSWITDGWKAGMQVVVTGAATAGNNIAMADLVKVLSVSATVLTLDSTTAITADEAFDSDTSLTTTAKFAKAATTRKFFTHEVTYSDLSPVVYEYFRGMEVNTMAINVPTSGEVTAEFNMIGLIGKITETEWDRSNNLQGTTTAGSSTRTAYSGNVSFAGSVEGSSLDRGGSLAPEVESLTVNINNNRAARFAVGQQSAAFVEEGDFDVELTMSLYFRDKNVQEQYLAGTRTSLTVTLKDQDDGHMMVLEFPRVVFTQGDKAISGQAVTQNCTGYAEEDPTTETKLKIWFIPAAVAA